MGVVLLEGFDYYWDATSTPHGAQANWVKGYLDQVLVLGRFGGQCLQHTRVGGTEDINRDLPLGNITTGQITIGFAFRVSNSVSRPLMRLQQAASSTGQLTIWQNTDGSIAIRLGNDGTVIATSAAGLVALNTWYYFELSAFIDNAGSLSFSIDGTEVINVSGVDTMSAANANVGRINIPEPNSSGTMWYDDIYVRDDLTKFGPSRILYRRPLAAIAGDFNLTATSSYVYPLRVDEHRADTSAYITADSVSDEQRFNFETLAKMAGATINAVQMVAFAKVDAGTGTLAPVVVSNGDSYVGPNWNLDTTFRFRYHVIANDPDTSAAWTKAALGLSEGGVRVTGLTGATLVSTSLVGYEVLMPIASMPAQAGGHRYWSIKPLTIASGRAGSWMLHLFASDDEYFLPISLAGTTGGLWSGSNDYRFAVDGRKDTGYISGTGASGTRFVMDYGGPIIPTKFWLGSQTFNLPESFRTFTVDYSDDGSTWTTLLTVGEDNPQTGWASGEYRVFALPDLTPPETFGRRRQALVLN